MKYIYIKYGIFHKKMQCSHRLAIITLQMHQMLHTLDWTIAEVRNTGWNDGNNGGCGWH